MDGAALAHALMQTPPGGEVQVPAGEFEGPFVIDQPLRLVGVGPASVLWTRHGLAMTIRSGGVSLEGLALEVTEDDDGIALQIEGAAQAAPPLFKGVWLLGRAEGLGPGRRWRVPRVIDLGRIQPNAAIQRTVGLEVVGPLAVKTELAGLTVTTQPLDGDRLALRLVLDGTGLSAGCILEGRVDVEAGGLLTAIRLTGMVEAPGRNVVTKQPPGGAASWTGDGASAATLWEAVAAPRRPVLPLAEAMRKALRGAILGALVGALGGGWGG